MSRFTLQEKEAIRKARQEGAGLTELARIHNCRPSTIQFICEGIEPKSDGNGYEVITGSELLTFLADWLPVHPNEGLPLPRWLVRQYGIGEWTKK